jgi:hypothetical protein
MRLAILQGEGGSRMSRDDPAAAPDAYRTFLEAKIAAPPSLGLPCDLDEVRSHLSDGRPMKEHVRHIVKWAVEGGRRGIFASFGLHKTMSSWRSAG